MKKTLFLLSLAFLLNGCVESVALLGTSVGGASSGKMLQSSINSTISYGIKRHTGKTPLGHALSYAEKNNPEKKRETCISFIEKTRSEFCTIVKKKISTTNSAIKEKVLKTTKIYPKSIDPIVEKVVIKRKNKVSPKASNSVNNLNQSKKTPRELAIAFQNELKKKLQSNYLVSI